MCVHYRDKIWLQYMYHAAKIYSNNKYKCLEKLSSITTNLQQEIQWIYNLIKSRLKHNKKHRKYKHNTQFRKKMDWSIL